MARTTEWHRFSIKQLLLLTALTAVAIFLWLRATRTERAANSLQALGAKANLPWSIACEGPQFGDEQINTLIVFKDLQTVSLANSRVTDSGLAMLTQLGELQSLNLHKTAVTDEGLKLLQRIDKLEVLDIGYTAIGLQPLVDLRNLHRLSLSGTRIRDQDLACLEGLPRLAQLDLSQTAVTDACIPHLQKIATLRSVNLRGTIRRFRRRRLGLEAETLFKN